MSWRMDARSLLAIVGGAVGVIGLWIALSNYLQEQPDLSLRVENVILRTEFDSLSLADQFTAIHDRYGVSVTHFFLLSLRQSVLALDDEDDQYERDLEELLAELQRVENFFTGDPRPWDRNEITYVDGVVTWPDNFQLDLTRHPLADTIFSAEIVEAAEESGPPDFSLSPELLDRLLDEAVQFDDPSRDDQGVRRRVRNELSTISQSIREAINGRDEVVHVDVMVFNRSRRPNMILDRGLLRVSGDGEVEMNLEEADGRLDGYAAQTFSFSRTIESLDQSIRNEVRRAFERSGEATFHVMDIDGETWDAPVSLP